MSWGTLTSFIFGARREHVFRNDDDLFTAEVKYEGLNEGPLFKFLNDEKFAQKVFHDMDEPFTHIDQLIGKMLERHFEEKRNSTGEAWEPLAASTLSLRMRDVSRVGSGGRQWRGNKAVTKGKFVNARGDKRGRRPSPASTTRALWATMEYFRDVTSKTNKVYYYNAVGTSWKKEKRIVRGSKLYQTANEFGFSINRGGVGGKRLGTPFKGKRVPRREVIFFDPETIEQCTDVIFAFVEKAFS